MGAKVNTPLQKRKYVKILHESMKHYNFEYKLGLNTDHIPFNPSGSGEPGGLYFTNLDNFYKFLGYGNLIADVTVPEGVKIYGDPVGDIWKAPSIIISNIRKISELPQWNDLSFWLAIVQKNGYDLKLVPDEFKTAEIYLGAVQQNEAAIRDIPNRLQTNELYLAAVRRNGRSLTYVPENLKTEEICLAAVQQNASA